MSAMGVSMDLLKEISRTEGVDEAVLRRRIETGRVVVPFNPVHSPQPCGIGEGWASRSTWTSAPTRDRVEVAEELEKVDIALRYGADAIMDLSTGGDIDAIRRQIIKASPMPVGTVPIYQTGLRMARKSAVVDMDEDDMFNGFVQHAKDGVDFMTVHCGITREVVERLKSSPRVTDVVSRGGSFLVAWMLYNGKENPFYRNFDYLLELAKEHEVALSLGDGMRPGCIHDATDGARGLRAHRAGRAW